LAPSVLEFPPGPGGQAAAPRNRLPETGSAAVRRQPGRNVGVRKTVEETGKAPLLAVAPSLPRRKIPKGGETLVSSLSTP